VLKPSDAVLAGFNQLPYGTRDSSHVFEVYQESANAVLAETAKNGKDYVRDTKAVLEIIGTPLLNPPNFKSMLDAPGASEVFSAIYGELEGCIVKHVVGSMWGNRDRGGGIYFFTSPEHIDTYIASEQWRDLSKGTPWVDVTYSKYVLV
jgi:hypothetical protein